MGNANDRTRNEHAEPSIPDTIHEMNRSARISFLIYGFIRYMNNAAIIYIPREITPIIVKYVGYDCSLTIFSKTEMKIRKEAFERVQIDADASRIQTRNELSLQEKDKLLALAKTYNLTISQVTKYCCDAHIADQVSNHALGNMNQVVMDAHQQYEANGTVFETKKLSKIRLHLYTKIRELYTDVDDTHHLPLLSEYLVKKHFDKADADVDKLFTERKQICK
eukprot:2056_1